ncbi:MAG: ABATE domain-containing protein [Anaerolineae bacterium]|nr:ABATE domain-containing protein [Anaerolineae bacterium]
MNETEPKAQLNLLLVGGRVCLDFCNTLEYRESDRPIELLANGYDALIRWSQYVNVIDDRQTVALLAVDSDSAPIRAVFEDAIRLREVLYRLFKAVVDRTLPAPADLAALNAAIQQAQAHRELVADEHGGLLWQWRDQDTPDFMLHPLALSAEDLLTADTDELNRLRQCPSCGWLFLDESRNRSRTWCDMRYCGNRAKAKRFHQRQKSGGA